jgi:hypothetical protein
MPVQESHDWIDPQLLAALYADAVDDLVTEDAGIHRKAKRLGLHTHVVYLAEAVVELNGLMDEAPPPLPAMEATKAHNLDSQDPIFDSVRSGLPRVR